MKLFDRSVDFAQFSEDTPLYALARAWMQNKPYGTKLSDSQDGNLDGDSPSNSQESALSSSSHSVSRKCCCAYVSSIDNNNSCFVEDVTTRQWLYFCFPELRYSLLEFSSWKICKFDKLNELKLAWQILKQHEFTWQWEWPVHQKPLLALWFLDCSLYWMNEP